MIQRSVKTYFSFANYLKEARNYISPVVTILSKCELCHSTVNLFVGPQCIAPGFPIEDEKVLMPGMILSDGTSQ